MPPNPMPTALVRLLKTLIVVLLPLLLIITSVRFLVTDQYLAFEYGKAKFPPDPYGFNPAQRLAYASSNFRYVREGQSIDVLASAPGNGAPLYTGRELKHMQDVQNVYQAVSWIWQMALYLILLLGLALAWRRETRPALAAALRWGGGLTAGIVSLIGGLAVMAWQLWFVAFHRVFFAAGTWTFDYADTLIRLFPETFWFDAALTIAAVSLIGGLLVSLVGRRLESRPVSPSMQLLPSTSPL